MNYCGRKLYQVEHLEEDPERHSGSNSAKLYLLSYPVVSIAKIKIDGAEIDDFRSSAKDRERGFVWRDSAWPLCVARYRDLTMDPNHSRAMENIEVAYVGGYKTPAQGDVEDGEYGLPEDLEECVFREAREILEGGRPSSRIKSERTPGGLALTFDLSGQYSLCNETMNVLMNGGYVAPWVI